MDLFKNKKIPNSFGKKLTKGKNILKPEVPNGLCVKCVGCETTVYSKELGMYNVCPECNFNFRIGARERIKTIADKNIFVEFDKDMYAKNPLGYPDYEQKIQNLKQKIELNDAVITGKCQIYGKDCVLGVMDSRFIMGSMGSVVGEKITRAFEYATEQKLHIIIFTASGGARMQEGIISLMQMAKVSAAVSRHSEAGLLYVTVLTDPTTGGVTASFAMLGDIIISEPKALIGFAGPRVIEQTIKQKLPEGFQTAEFLLENGFVDHIVKREDMKKMLSTILKIHRRKEPLV